MWSKGALLLEELRGRVNVLTIAILQLFEYSA